MIKNSNESYMHLIEPDSKDSEHNKHSKGTPYNNTKDNEEDSIIWNMKEVKEPTIDYSVRSQAESEGTGSIISERSKDFTFSDSLCLVLN